MARYWINYEFADGTESDYESSPTYKTEKAARATASQSCVTANVIDNGTVVATYVNGIERSLAFWQGGRERKREEIRRMTQTKATTPSAEHTPRPAQEIDSKDAEIMLAALNRIREIGYNSQASRATDTVLAAIRLAEEAIAAVGK